MEKLFTKFSQEKTSEKSNNLDADSKIENKMWDFVNFQFQYIDKLEKGEISSENNKYIDFRDRLEAYTSIADIIRSQYSLRFKNEDFDDTKYAEFYDFITNLIADDYKKDNENWAKNVRKIINIELDKIGPALSSWKDNRDNSKVGLIEYDNKKKYQDLEQYGISKNAKCLTLHFASYFSQKLDDENIGGAYIGDSLKKLAINIKDNSLDSEAIVAISWLLDTRIGKGIGFKVYEIENGVGQNMDFWGQFMDKNGDLKQKEAKNFLETGIPKYNVVHGFIKTKDFLERYLPKK